MKLKELLTLIDDQDVMLMILDDKQKYNTNCMSYSVVPCNTLEIKNYPLLSKYLNRTVKHIGLNEYLDFGLNTSVTKLEIYI